MERLRYFGRLVRHGPLFLKAALDEDKHWLLALYDDLRWLMEIDDKAKHFPDPGHDFAPWRNHARLGGPWRSLMRRARLWATRPRDANDDAPAPLDAEQTAFSCYDCGRDFRTRSALCVHAAQIHDYVAPAATAAFGTTCVACLRDYRTRTRVLAHLRTAPRRCLDAIQANVPPASPEEQEAFLAEARALTATFRGTPRALGPEHWPRLRASGPLPAWA